MAYAVKMRKLSKFFRDSRGNVVLIQFPNVPILLVGTLSLLQYGANATVIFYSSWAIKILLLYWSYLEIRFGVNGFRKLLGVVVSLYTAIGVVRLLTISI